MAYNDQEIELKLPLSEDKFKRIIKILRNKAKFVKSSHHIDDYYTPIRVSFLKRRYPFEWLTIRQRDGIISINYKHWYPENTKYTTHCDEYEVKVDNKIQAEKILEALKFKKFISVEKKRMIFMNGNSLEIALDEGKDLGFFIEVETLKDFGSVQKARKVILEFTKSLGLKETKTVPGGYAHAMIRSKLSKK